MAITDNRPIGGDGSGGGGVDSVNGQTGVVVLSKADIGLDMVDNVSDANKPVSSAQQMAIDLKADLTYVVDELALKADLDYVDMQLALKADLTYVDMELALKADQTYVDDQLALKLDSANVPGILEAITTKRPVHALAINNIDMTDPMLDQSIVDGQQLLDGDRVLLAGQTLDADNGIYIAVDAQDATTWIRSLDFDTPGDINDAVIPVKAGLVYTGYHIFVITMVNTVGVDPIFFAARIEPRSESPDPGKAVVWNADSDINYTPAVPSDYNGANPDGIFEALDYLALKTNRVMVESYAVNFNAVFDYVYLVTAALDVQLPSPLSGRTITVKKTGNFTVNLVRFGAELIDGVAANKSLTSTKQSVTLLSDGTDWYLI